jgi:hypothetical protein
VWTQNGADPFVGRRLPGLLRAAGVHRIGTQVHAQVHQADHSYRMLLLSFVENVHDTVLARGLLDERELTKLSESLREHLSNPATVVIFSLLVQAWGRKP